jgi:hypothetical protein
MVSGLVRGILLSADISHKSASIFSKAATLRFTILAAAQWLPTECLKAQYSILKISGLEFSLSYRGAWWGIDCGAVERRAVFAFRLLTVEQLVNQRGLRA